MKKREDAHDLMPAEIAARVPALYATENEPDPVLWVKLFTPDSNWTWYVTEYDPKQRLCYGWVEGLEQEIGYFSLDELEDARGPFGLQIERDLYWTPRKLSEVRR